MRSCEPYQRIERGRLASTGGSPGPAPTPPSSPTIHFPNETNGIPNGFRIHRPSLFDFLPFDTQCEFGACGIGNGLLQGGPGETTVALACLANPACVGAVVTGLIALQQALLKLYPISFAQHGRGDFGDTGIAQEVTRRFPKMDRCDALDILMDEAKSANDTTKIVRIQGQQKQWNCRRHR